MEYCSVPVVNAQNVVQNEISKFQVNFLSFIFLLFFLSLVYYFSLINVDIGLYVLVEIECNYIHFPLFAAYLKCLNDGLIYECNFYE